MKYKMTLLAATPQFGTMGHVHAQALRGARRSHAIGGSSAIGRVDLLVHRSAVRGMLHILDRFHIVPKMNKALDEVRAAESRKMAQESYPPLLKKSRWCVLKRKQNLTAHQQVRLRDLLRYNLQTVRAYLLKEDFQQVWTYNSPTWAGMFLDFWCDQTMRSRIEPMKKIARTLRAHRALLINYFKAKKQFSSGVIEGLNNKAKVTMRRCYGFRTFHIL